jgi:E3 ubiquitin-protein ligase DOA10
MHAPRTAPSPADLANEVNNQLVSVGILTMQFFPLALPFLVFVVAPLALVAAVGVLLAGILVLPFRLARMVLRSRSYAIGTPFTPRTSALRREH